MSVPLNLKDSKQKEEDTGNYKLAKRIIVSERETKFNSVNLTCVNQIRITRPWRGGGEEGKGGEGSFIRGGSGYIKVYVIGPRGEIV